MTDRNDANGAPRIRMPIEDRIPPEAWVTEQPCGPSPTAAADAEWADAERRRIAQEAPAASYFAPKKS